MRLFQQSLQTFKMAGAEKSKNFADLLHFMGHLAGGKTTDCEWKRKKIRGIPNGEAYFEGCMEIRALGGISSFFTAETCANSFCNMVQDMSRYGTVTRWQKDVSTVLVAWWFHRVCWVPRGDCLDEQGKSAEALRCTQPCLSIEWGGCRHRGSARQVFQWGQSDLQQVSFDQDHKLCSNLIAVDWEHGDCKGKHGLICVPKLMILNISIGHWCHLYISLDVSVWGPLGEHGWLYGESRLGKSMRDALSCHFLDH